MAININGTGSITGLSSISSPTISGGSLPAGSASAPGLTFSGDSNTGIYSPGADQVAVATNGVGRLFINDQGNVGIGVSASTASGRRLVVRNDGSAELRVTDGTNNLYFTCDTISNQASIVHDGANSLGITAFQSTNIIFRTANTERLRITSTGLVGIGTSSPVSNLHVNSGGNTLATVSSSFSNSVETGFAINTTGDNSRGKLEFQKAGAGRGAVLYFHNTSGALERIGLNVAGTEGLSVLGSGRVGVGTASPASTIHASGSSGSVGVRITSGSSSGEIAQNGTDFYVVNAANGPTQFWTNGSERCRLDSSGRLLVGTSSSSANSLLTVVGFLGTPTGVGVIQIKRGSNATANDTDLGTIWFGDGLADARATITAASDAAGGAGDTPSRLVFSTTADGASSPTERMRISNQGDLSMADGRYIYVNGNGDSPRGGLVCTNTSNNTTATVITFKGWDGSTTGTITTRVNVTAYNTSSDYRLKENIVDLEDATSRIKQLKPKRFNFTANPDETLDGFLAHEAQLVVPEAVSGYKDQVDADGNPVHQGVDLGKFVPLLTAALQEAIGRIETLEAEVTALKG